MKEGRNTITRVELLALIERGEAPTVLDVRTAAEFAADHVPGARHVPFWKVPFGPLDFPAERPVVVYCGHGPRAWIAAAALRWRGVRRVLCLAGHMAGWRSSRGP